MTTHHSAVSTFSLSSDHMSPAALALAVMLHGVVAFALWWMSTHRPLLPTEPPPIEVTIEQPKPEQPKPEPPKAEPPKAEPAPTPPKETPAPPKLGIAPPVEIESNKPTQVYSTPEQTRDALAPHPDNSPEKQAEKMLEQAIPPPPPEQPPPQTAFEKPAPEPPKVELPSQPRQHTITVPVPPPPRPPQTEIRPSPLDKYAHGRPNMSARNEVPAPSPFVNPADTYNRGRMANNYLWEIARKLQGYHFMANVQVSQGTTVIRIVVARDGRLLDVAIAQSSGYPELDRGVLEGVRAGSPYAPLPPDIQGSSATFTLPLVATHRD